MGESRGNAGTVWSLGILDDEAAEFDQMPRALAALDLPGAHVMPRLRRLLLIARRPVAPPASRSGETRFPRHSREK